MSAELTAQLTDALGGAEIRELRRLTGGASRQTWAFDARIDGRWRPLIVRRDRPGRGAMTVESAAIAAAARAGVPEPEIVAVDESMIVMERVEGETIPRRILREDAYAEVRPRLASQCGEILARIHSIPVQDVPGLATHDALENLTAMIHAFDDPAPALELGLDWLGRNRPRAVDDCVLHGDYRLGNLIVGTDGIRAILDWELVHRGDPMQDLGYLCVRAWRFGGELPVGGFGSYEDLFESYERVSGRGVDREAVGWWELFGTVWWGAACMLQAWRHLSGSEPSVELAAIGRRVWEQEYDVLLALA